MISMTSEHFSESMSRSGSEGYWSWDPESFIVVLSRKNSLQDMVEKMDVSHITPALQSPTVSMSRCSTLRPKRQSSSYAPFPSPLVTTAPICDSLQSPSTPKFRNRPSPLSQFEPFPDVDSCNTSFTNDSSLHTSEGDWDNGPNTNSTPVLLGLGIIGLTNKCGTPLNETGVVGLSQNAFIGGEDNNSAEYACSRHVSFALIDEVSLSFSPPLRNPALQRIFATCVATPTLAVRTPTPYPHEFMESAGGEYFPLQNVELSSPLRHVFASCPARTVAGRICTPYPHDLMEAVGGEYFPELSSPLQHVFASFPARSVAGRICTPYPCDFMEAVGGEYFHQQNLGIGLGIFGLAGSDGEPFDGTGIISLQENAGHYLVDGGDDDESVLTKRVSRLLIEEVKYTFSSTAHQPHSFCPLGQVEVPQL